MQSISEEEQQRILAEQKMVGFKKSTGGANAGTKKNSKAKVSLHAYNYLAVIVCPSTRIYTSLYLFQSNFQLIFSCHPCVHRVVLLSRNDRSLPCSYLRKKRGRSFSRRDLTCLIVNSPDFWLACGMTSRTRRRYFLTENRPAVYPAGSCSSEF